MRRLIDRWALRTTERIFVPLGVMPKWSGPVRNWRWRLVLAWMALRGYEVDWYR